MTQSTELPVKTVKSYTYPYVMGDIVVGSAMLTWLNCCRST